MKTRSELKSESKELLKGHWGKAILLNIIPIVGSIISISLMIDPDSARHVAETIDSTNGNVSSGSSGADFGRNLTVN